MCSMLGLSVFHFATRPRSGYRRPPRTLFESLIMVNELFHHLFTTG
jgi:hypothetical protein